jgi:multimeric flavodoxin WrbA
MNMNIIDENFPRNYQKIKTQNSVLGINGSPRKNGNSETILKQITSGISQSDCETNRVNLREYQFSSCIGCERCRKDKICTGVKDAMSHLYPVIMRSRGLVLVSPAHNYNVTAMMKSFIDRLYCFYDFENTRPRAWSSRLADQGRKAMIITICEQQDKEEMGFTTEAMEMPLKALGYDIVKTIPIFGIFDAGGVKNNAGILQMLHQYGEDFGKPCVEN